METPTFFAGYHKLVFRPDSSFPTTDESVNELTTKLFNIPLSKFENKSSGISRQYIETLTYNRLIDLTFKNSPTYGKCLDRVTVQGSAFDYMTFSMEFMRNYLWWEEFRVIELHSKLDIPKTLISFQTIKDHFIHHAYVAPGCKLVTHCSDPSNDYAETYYAGKRATNGKRVAFYEAGKIHEDLQDITRMELQLFGRDAHSFFEQTAFGDKDPLDEIWADGRPDLTEKTIGVIMGHIEFKTMTGHENRSRRVMAPWWRTIIREYSKINLPRTFRNPAGLQGQEAKLKAVFYEKRQKLGEESFIRAFSEFATELCLTEKLDNYLRQLT